MAVRAMACPSHLAPLGTVMLVVGRALTLTVVLAVLEQEPSLTVRPMLYEPPVLALHEVGLLEVLVKVPPEAAQVIPEEGGGAAAVLVGTAA